MGRGVSQDFSKALHWYKKSAGNGNTVAQYNLGVLFMDGRGTAVENKTAISWWQKAANQGLLQAQKNLGIAYWRGDGVSKDLIKARMWLDIAIRYADIGVLEEIHNLAYTVEKQMTPSQIAEAKRLAAEWKPVK